MTDDEFDRLMAELREAADHGRLPPAPEQDDEYAMLARHAEFGAGAH
ncbi:hypothetical protein [Streptomyces beijiangensis]|uniref:Uncharacterized protein n=1 Tax=Streptomyces beijiangensis TaxID=163361 RepID=A0A939JH41_9ACTN|nr:hypothetical protein [Streptomyces beijiangensis]MBO0511144.1 hypothetical protein [Streptomyces beijiangensis]